MPWTRGSAPVATVAWAMLGDRGQVVQPALENHAPWRRSRSSVGRHGRVAVEVVHAHPVEDQQHDQPRPCRARAADTARWLRPEAVDGIGTPSRSASVGRHVLLRDRLRVTFPCARSGARRGGTGCGCRTATGCRACRTGGFPPRDDVALPGHHGDLAGAAGEPGAGEPLEEGLPEVRRPAGRRRVRRKRGRHGGQDSATTAGSRLAIVLMRLATDRQYMPPRERRPLADGQASASCSRVTDAAGNRWTIPTGCR